jgi:hypothetical protein
MQAFIKYLQLHEFQAESNIDIDGCRSLDSLLSVGGVPDCFRIYSSDGEEV